MYTWRSTYLLAIANKAFKCSWVSTPSRRMGEECEMRSVPYFSRIFWCRSVNFSISPPAASRWDISTYRTTGSVVDVWRWHRNRGSALVPAGGREGRPRAGVLWGGMGDRLFIRVGESGVVGMSSSEAEAGDWGGVAVGVAGSLLAWAAATVEGGLVRGGAGGLWDGGACGLGMDIGDESGDECWAPTKESGAGGSGFLWGVGRLSELKEMDWLSVGELESGGGAGRGLVWFPNDARLPLVMGTGEPIDPTEEAKWLGFGGGEGAASARLSSSFLNLDSRSCWYFSTIGSIAFNHCVFSGSLSQANMNRRPHWSFTSNECGKGL